MALKPKPIPDGHTAVTPCLVIADAADATEFYKKSFVWTISTHIEDAPPEEVNARAAKLFGGGA